MRLVGVAHSRRSPHWSRRCPSGRCDARSRCAQSQNVCELRRRVAASRSTPSNRMLRKRGTTFAGLWSIHAHNRPGSLSPHTQAAPRVAQPGPHRSAQSSVQKNHATRHSPAETPRARHSPASVFQASHTLHSLQTKANVQTVLNRRIFPPASEKHSKQWPARQARVPSK